MGEDSGAVGVTREELVSIVQQLASQGVKIHLPEHWKLDTAEGQLESTGEETTGDNHEDAAVTISESPAAMPVPNSATGIDESSQSQAPAQEPETHADLHDQRESLPSIAEEQSREVVPPTDIDTPGLKPTESANTAADSETSTISPQPAVTPESKATRQVSIQEDVSPLPSASSGTTDQPELCGADEPENSTAPDDQETHPLASSRVIDLNPWAEAIKGQVSECQHRMEYLLQVFKQFEVRLKSVEKGFQTLGSHQGSMIRTLSIRAKAQPSGSKELQSLRDLHGFNKSFKNISVPDTSKESEAIKRQVEEFHALAAGLSESFAEASRESRGQLEDLSNQVAKGLEELAAADQYLMSCIGGVAQDSEAQGRELTAHVKHTRAGLQAIKDWVMTELGNIRGQEKALEIKHMQNTAVMDSFRSKLADFNDKLRVHTHDEIYEFVDVQIRNLASQVEVLLRSTLHESLRHKSGQTERQLAALARSHEKLSSNFEELKMFVGKGQMPVARNKPARGATRAERTQHSSASFPKGGGFFPPIAAPKQPSSVRSQSNDGKPKDDVESLGVYNRSEQVSLASGISDALTVAGGVPAALSAEESITTVMAVVGRDGTVASVSEPGGMVEAIGQGDQPPDLSIH